jgi:putative glutamine amidotransferase
VRLEPGTRTAAVVGAGSLRTNSMHHQAVRELGNGLRATGWAADGVIEAMESGDPAVWMVAVQWHPEEHAPGAPDEGLFRALVTASRGA